MFAVLQRFGRHPLLDLSLFRIRFFTGTSVVALLARVVSFGLLAYLVLFREAVYRLDALQIGVRLLAMSLLLEPAPSANAGPHLQLVHFGTMNAPRAVPDVLPARPSTTGLDLRPSRTRPRGTMSPGTPPRHPARTRG
ncbi:hypothetical protein [Actinomadura geliboluensis]|uniref:Uncharacterized protein n=1 Tax=Actinomadura geliboluensis TaxID=882440 RepID=A0A5S4G355_9ACTN|nr:hypothetical protein [Actinomadura geliboluensis]TMR26944.1 hypothetical protein ETD96_40270 [Actinomadura geliboluensis]